MLDFFAGFLTSVLSGLGIGGGGLLVIWLVLFNCAEQLTAQGINLIFFLFSSTAAMTVHMMRRKINWRLVAYMATLGCIGAIVGSTMVRSMSPETVQTCFGALLVISGGIALFK